MEWVRWAPRFFVVDTDQFVRRESRAGDRHSFDRSPTGFASFGAAYGTARTRTAKALREIRADVDKLKKKYQSSPQQLGLALSKLYKDHGVKPVEATNLLGMLVQVALGAGIYSAIRRGLGSGGHFLWVRNLAQPNLPLTIGTGV